MARLTTNIVIILAILLALAIVGGMVWANSLYVREQPMEKNFMVPWLAARTFLQYGSNPYGIEAAQRAQVSYYGKLAEGSQDPLYLWLPMPSELFYFPFAFITDYNWARAAWLTSTEIALMALGILSLRLVKWRPSRTLLAVILLTSPLWVYGIFSLVSSNGTAFAALGLVGFLLSLRGEHDELGGALLLLALGTPSLTGLLAFFMTWWVISQRRWRILAGFLMGLIFLLALSFLLLPGWIFPYLTGLTSFLHHNSSLSSVGIFTSWSPVFGQRLGWAFAGILLLLLFVEWGAALRNEVLHLVWTVNLTVVAMPLMGVPSSITNYVLFFIPIILLIHVLVENRSRPHRWGAGIAVLVLLLVGLWMLVVLLARAGKYTAISESLFLILPVLLFGGLYWIRWRFTRRKLLTWELLE